MAVGAMTYHPPWDRPPSILIWLLVTRYRYIPGFDSYGSVIECICPFLSYTGRR